MMVLEKAKVNRRLRTVIRRGDRTGRRLTHHVRDTSARAAEERGFWLSAVQRSESGLERPFASGLENRATACSRDGGWPKHDIKLG